MANRTVASLFRLPAKALSVLGLPSNAGLEQARRAHRALALQLHPDLEFNRSKAVGDGSGSCRSAQLVAANAARQAIEEAVKSAAASQSTQAEKPQLGSARDTNQGRGANWASNAHGQFALWKIHRAMQSERVRTTRV